MSTARLRSRAHPGRFDSALGRDILDSMPQTNDNTAQDPLVSLASAAIRAYVEDRQRLAVPDPVPSGMKQEAGSFVSIKNAQGLRGCIGTFSPTQPSLAQEIISNAIAAATEDPRFPPIEPNELDGLSISVDVLSAPEECQEDDLDPKRYGVMVERGWHRGLLLPDLEGVDSVQMQLSIAKRKAGIAEDVPCTLYRFTVERHQ